MYKIFYKYYDGFVGDRSHFNVQANVILKIIESLKIINPIVHDAACGTGEVLSILNKNNIYLSGSDKSKEMLSIAKRKIKNIFLFQSNYTNLFQKNRKFDILFCLGNSLSHIKDFEELKESLLSFKKSLINDNSVLIVDFRLWFHSVGLSQKGRPLTEILKNKNNIFIDGEMYNFYEKCYYDNNRQYIDYRILNINKNTEEKTTLSYLMFSINQFLNIATEVGFENIEIHTKYVPNYPYLIAILK